MKFDKAQKIYEAAAKDDSRYAITAVMFERDDKGARLVATDGRIIAVVPVTDADGDVPGLVSLDALTDATKGRSKASPDATVLLPDETRSIVHTKKGTAEVPRPVDAGRFPDYTAVIPKADDGLEITLSSGLLLRLAKAIGAMGDNVSDAITLKFAAERSNDGSIIGISDGSPVRVSAGNTANNAYGVIMPVSVV